MNIFDNFFEGTDGMDEFVPDQLMPMIIPDDDTFIDYREDLDQLDPSLPVLALRDMVLFPAVTIPVMVARDKSVRLLDYLRKEDKRHVLVVAQKDAEEEFPNYTDLIKVGTVAEVLRVIEVSDRLYTVILQGKSRIELRGKVTNEPFITAKYRLLEDTFPHSEDMEFEALVMNLKEMMTKILLIRGDTPKPFISSLSNMTHAESIINLACVYFPDNMEEKSALLMDKNLKSRAFRVLRVINYAFQLEEMKLRIHMQTKTDMDKQQKDYFLQQQLRVIREELSEGEDGEAESEALLTKAKEKVWSKEVQETFEREVKKLQRMNTQSPDYSIQLQYLNTILDLPWGEYTDDNFSISHAERILNRDHYGMDKVKERILEHLAVLKLKDDLRAPIICLYGPPGVGKTSLGRSIADALGRKYVRISLGGLHDEAEIRGHRRTYIGAMPGRIIKGFLRAGSGNPVFVLDEVDKLAFDYKGDPSSALLEVLDPEQNNTFHDNYLDIDYDLSKALFIATANNVGDIPAPLLDRMELIEVSGYIAEEKIEIATKHLLPKELNNHGLTNMQVKIGRRTIAELIEKYTRESGVRQLEKQIASLLRKVAKKIALASEHSEKEGGEEEGLKLPITISPSDLEHYLGAPLHTREMYEGNRHAGVVTGLAWTSVGGEILTIESAISPSKSGKMSITGNLGDVMKESAVLALEYIKSNATKYEIAPEIFEAWNVHIHVPEGAIPKDGPSAGITLVTSLTSTFTQRKVKPNIAMTGEITLRGKVLPVGGIREKILAAKRSGIKQIILSEQNRKDVAEIKEDYLKGLQFIYVNEIPEVIDAALMKSKVEAPIDLDKRTKEYLAGFHHQSNKGHAPIVPC